jgi:hypothetical protein
MVGPTLAVLRGTGRSSDLLEQSSIGGPAGGLEFPRPKTPVISSHGLADGKWEVAFHSGAGTANAPV